MYILRYNGFACVSFGTFFTLDSITIKANIFHMEPQRTLISVHRCGLGGSLRACDVAGPGSIPGRDKFPG